MSQKLFIASGIFHPESGGPATYLYELLPQLQARGWEIRAQSYGSAPPNHSYPYPLKRIPRTLSLPMRISQYAKAALPQLQWADLVYIHSLSLPLIGGKAARVVKIVGDQAWERSIRKGWIGEDVNIDDFQTQKFSLAAQSAKLMRAREIRAADGVIVPSEYLRQMVIGWGVEPVRVHVVYNALPPIDTLPDITQPEARQMLNLEDAPTILTVGRLVAWKGVDHLIEALAHVSDLRLIVVGDGPMLAALKAHAIRWKVNDRVKFVGRIEREWLSLYYRAADYTALYSGYEGLSHTLLESLRMGTPIIASNKGGNPEVVKHGVNGLLVPYIDIDALADALVQAYQPGTRARFVANADVGMTRFEFDTMIEKTDQTLREYL